jgi:hypothetical protein
MRTSSCHGSNYAKLITSILGPDMYDAFTGQVLLIRLRIGAFFWLERMKREADQIGRTGL